MPEKQCGPWQRVRQIETSWVAKLGIAALAVVFLRPALASRSRKLTAISKIPSLIYRRSSCHPQTEALVAAHIDN